MSQIITGADAPGWMPFLQAGFSTVLGGVISAGVAYAMQRRAAAERLAEEAGRRQEAKRVAARRLIVKLHAVANGLYLRHAAIEEGLEEADQRGLGGFLFARMRPIVAAPPTPVEIDVDEASLLLEVKEADSLNKAYLLVEGWKHFLHGLSLYEIKRATVLAELGEGSANSTIGTLSLTAEQARKWGPEIASLEELAGQVRTQAAELWPRSADLLQRVGKRLREHFGDDPTIPLPGPRPGVTLEK